jgi:ABC-type lipoprotein export system ATPase subunit
MTEAVLMSSGVTKTYFMGDRQLPVLRGVDLELRRGEFVALQGASGSGKSTLLQLLGGLDKPSAGTIYFRGKSMVLQSARAAALYRGNSVGFVFQAYHLLPDLDALENVMLPAQVRRSPAAESRRRASELLGSVGLADRMDHRPSELSGGEQQRVAIARALMNEPEIVLADEPTGNLDTGTEAEIMGLLKNLHEERQLTLLVATHDDVVASAAERVVHLQDGKVTD